MPGFCDPCSLPHVHTGRFSLLLDRSRRRLLQRFLLVSSKTDIIRRLERHQVQDVEKRKERCQHMGDRNQTEVTYWVATGLGIHKGTATPGREPGILLPGSRRIRLLGGSSMVPRFASLSTGTFMVVFTAS